MTYFKPRHHELRDIHDWDNPLRSAIDGLEVIVLLSITLYSFFFALGPTYRGDDGEIHSVYSLFGLLTHWHTLWHLIVGAVVSLTGVLLLRDWMYGAQEREEERRRRKEWREDLARIREADMASEVPNEMNCPDCKGTGNRAGEDCSRCGGTGKLPIQR
jgi:hypothetical protein